MGNFSCFGSSSATTQISKLQMESPDSFLDLKMITNYEASMVPPRLSHPNVIKLLSCHDKYQEQLLVRKLMHNLSLDKHLFNIDPSICWATRLTIAIGVARGLTFLHSSAMPAVHGDLTSSNILLDGSYNPKIAGSSFPTLGELADENMNDYNGVYSFGDGLQPDLKKDVYSFGVVLLEILTGLRARDLRRPDGEKDLVVWAIPLLSDRINLKTIMDARLAGQYSKDAAFKAAQLALKCLSGNLTVRRMNHHYGYGDLKAQWVNYHYGYGDSEAQQMNHHYHGPSTGWPTMKEVLHSLERIQRT